MECGHWQLSRFDPRRLAAGQNPFQLDSKAPTLSYKDWALGETRFKTLMQKDAKTAERLLAEGDVQAKLRFRFYEQLAAMQVAAAQAAAPAAPKA